VFKGQKLLQSFDVWPKQGLENYKAALKRVKQKRDDDKLYIPISKSLFLDKDDEGVLYLQMRGKVKGDVWIYKFDFKGKLLEVIAPKESVIFTAKRNMLFYAISLKKSSILIYKEK
ncbi:MAG: hypothetical protein GY765_03620, partial [bacterium]|nr:hypothetical protein [bacterium]